MTNEPTEGWQPTRWWQVYDPEGNLLMETSDEDEARDALRPGDRLGRWWLREEMEWREEPRRVSPALNRRPPA